MEAKVGIIGGSGFYQMDGLNELRKIEVETPFGLPSHAVVVGKIDRQAVAFLPRHGIGHPLLPSEINVQANIYALKSLGVELHNKENRLVIKNARPKECNKKTVI